MLTAEEAAAFVCKHGVVLMSGNGPVPRLVEAIAGEPIRGSWWAHPQSRAIFSVLRALESSPDILVCRLIDAKITYVHRRLWAALVKNADDFDHAQLAQVHQEHTTAGRHKNTCTEFPDWVPKEEREAARRLSQEEAARLLAPIKSITCSESTSPKGRTFR